MNNFLGEQNAIDALELLEAEEEDEDAFNEGLTLGKLSLVVPILERVFTDSKLDERLRFEAIGFLKAAFGLDFLTVSQLSLCNLFDFRSRNENGCQSN